MPYVFKGRWIFAVIFVIVLRTANLQIGMPMYMPAMPPPVYAFQPIAVAIHIPQTVTKTTTTTTTTTMKPDIAIAVPVPVPMPVQIAVPALPPPIFCQNQPRAKSCPPCPPCICLPSCTPAFFSYCSPCHQRCRCRSADDAPVPLPPNPPIPVPGPAYPVPVPVPAPVMGPPPVVVLPFAPPRPHISLLPDRRKRKRRRRPIRPYISSSSDTSDSSCSESSCSSSDSDIFRSGKKFKRRRSKIFRRSAGASSDGENELVKPILSYVAKNGDVKYETKISNKKAMEMLGEKDTDSNEEQIVNGENSVVVTNGRSNRRYNKVLLKDDTTSHVLDKGNNRLVFRPPPNKKINNVAVSFQVS